MTTPCIAHRRDCYENKDKKNQCGKDPLIAGAKIKGLEVICNKTLCNDNKSEGRSNIKIYTNFLF